MPTAAQIVAQAPQLASLPSVYLKVRRALSMPEVSILDLARIISTDPAMTARLLQVVNSPFYGLSRQVQSISRALSILGMQQVHDLVVATCLATTFRGIRPAQMDMTAFWHASVYRALAGRRIARHCRLIDADRPFIDGLLADLGHLILYLQMPEQAMEARARMKTAGSTLVEAERKVIGCDYAQIGEALLHAWRLPPGIQDAVGRHAEPPAEGPFALEAAITHVAAFLALSMQAGPNPLGPEIAATAWRLTGLTPAALAEVHSAALAEVGEVMNLFFPQRAAA